MLTKGLRYFHFGTIKNADQLEGVDHSFALIVIIGDDVSVASLLGDSPNACNPRIELVGGVKVIVALMRGSVGIVGEPGIVTAAMEADVADLGCTVFGWRRRVADDGLIDIAETDATLAEEFKNAGGLPGGMAKFNDQWIILKAGEHGSQELGCFGGAMKRERELGE